jgi:hypothetical protein
VPQWVAGAPRFVVASGPPLGGPPTGTVTVVAFAPHASFPPPAARVTGLTPAGFGEARIAVGGPPTDGLLLVYRRFSVFGGAEMLPTVRRSSRGPCAAAGNVFCSSPPLGGNGSPTALERTSISLCALASQSHGRGLRQCLQRVVGRGLVFRGPLEICNDSQVLQ